MIDQFLQVLGLLLTVVIYWRTESVLNLMAPGCRFLVRVAFWLIVVGAAGVAVWILQGYVPPVVVLIMLSGVALLVMSERRVRAILRVHTPIIRNRRAEA